MAAQASSNTVVAVPNNDPDTRTEHDPMIPANPAIAAADLAALRAQWTKVCAVILATTEAVILSYHFREACRIVQAKMAADPNYQPRPVAQVRNIIQSRHRLPQYAPPGRIPPHRTTPYPGPWHFVDAALAVAGMNPDGSPR